MENSQNSKPKSKNDIIRAELFELPDEATISKSKAAVYLKMHRSKFQELADTHKLPHRKIGREPITGWD